MSLLHIDSMHELNNLNRVYPSGGASWVANCSANTGRDGVASGSAFYGVSTTATTLRLASGGGISGTAVVGIAWNGSAVVTGFNHTIMCLLGDSLTAPNAHLTLCNSTTGRLELRRGTAAGTVIATSANTLEPNAWHYYELKCSINDSTGSAIARVDGVEWINFSGDTRNGGTFAGVDGLQFVAGSSGSFFWDDLYILDTGGAAPNDFLGDIIVKRLFANGNGATNQFVGSDADSVNNYLLTDENPANTSDYAGSAVAGQRDLYTLDDLPGTANTVYAMQAFVTAAKSDAGSRQLKVLDRGSATVRAATAQSPGTTYAHLVSPLYTTDGDSAALTPAVVNAVQVGAEVV